LVRATQTAQSRVGSLTIGFYPGIASGPLRDALVEFISESPNVGLHFVEGVPGELHRRLNDRTIDIMFGALMPEVSTTKLAQENLWHERLVVALPEDHPLAAKPHLDWQDVSSLPIMLRTVLGEISGYRAIVARIGDRPLNCEHHAVSRGALLELVAMGLGATVSFESAVVPREGVAFRPIHDSDAVVAIKGAWHDGDRNPLRHRLVALIRKHAAATIID
jgi:LysR family hydrogen peroxide-inducible transcriptional activator